LADTTGAARVHVHPPPAVRDASALDLGALRGRFAAEVTAWQDDVGEPTALVTREALRDVARYLRDDLGYRLLRSVTAVDLLPHVPRYQVVYHVTALPGTDSDPAPTRLLRIKVALTADDPVVDSLTPIYPTANYHERETYDMFGIEFVGHPNLRRILMPDTYDGHPLRKDHPLVYEAVAFSHNQDDVMRDKPVARA
jgi:NADH-quinone oxidoreductase subunit C